MAAAAITITDEVQLLREENAVLRAQIGWLKQQLFGPGKGEQLERAQLLLQLDALEKIAAAARPVETITYERPAGPAPKRTLPAESFAHLPVKETVEIVPEAVLAAPELYEKIGEERTFEVDVVPPQLFKREIVRPKFRHCLDRNRAPLLAPAPKRVVAGGFASAGLIAWALTAKYCDHLPLYRQEKMLARWAGSPGQGAPISRQNLCDWAGAATALLEPLVKRMKQDLLAGGYVVADETPIRCNDPDLRDGKTTQGWLWALARPGGDVVFEWRLSRRHEELTRLLGENYRGLLQSDGYEAYASYARTHAGVEWLGCWAHARRGFHDALAEAPARAGFVLRLIGSLYRYEAQWRTAGPRLRAARRQGHFGLTLTLLQKTAQKLQHLCLPRSQLGQACAYLLGHWTPLTAHLAHGRTQLDTNAVENVTPRSALRSLFRDRDHAEMPRVRAEDYGVPAGKRRRATRHNRRADRRRTCGLPLALICWKCAGLYTGRSPRVTYVFPAEHHNMSEAPDGGLCPHRGWVHGLSAATAHRPVYDRALSPVSQAGSGIPLPTRPQCI